MIKDLKAIFGKDHGLDQKSVEFLTNALEKKNLPGFDYIEFKQSLGALAQMDMDEAIAYKSAFATASTMGLTKQKLKETALHYLGIIQKEREHFEQAMQNQIQQRVNSKQEEVMKLKDQIVKHQEKIQQLQEQIQKYQATVDGADAKIEAARNKIEATRNSFDMTHQSIINQIKKDIENIENYI